MNGTGIKTFKDLIVWRKAFDLVVEVYRLSANFPNTNCTVFRQSCAKLHGRSCATLPKDINDGVRVNTFIFSEFPQDLPPNWNLKFCCQIVSDIFKRRRAEDAKMLSEIVRMLDALIKTLQRRLIPTPNPSTPYSFPDRGYSRMRSLPTRRVNFSRSRYSSSGMACLRRDSRRVP